jgi:phosphate transport system substrate-binding protein
MRKYFIPLLVCLSLVLTSCGSDDTKDMPVKENNETPITETSGKYTNGEKEKFTKGNYPRIDGSTATIPLSRAMAKELLGMSEEEAKDYVKHNTTHEAYMRLIQGEADIIFVTEPSIDELTIAKDAKVELEIIPVVKEGFVFLVNTNNPIESLTIEQLQDIYQGKIKNWIEVGGKDAEIIAYQRDPNSGSQTLMEQIVMKGLKIIEAPRNVIEEMGSLIDRIAQYDNAENALGYSVYFYAKSMYNKDTIKLIAVDGVAPSNKTISSGEYPFTSAYYAVIRKTEAKDSAARSLLNWVLSEEGQKVAEDAGYATLEVK